jgi:hypothetical protein
MFSEVRSTSQVHRLCGSKWLLSCPGLLVLALLLGMGFPQQIGAQVMEGELRVEVRDPAGRAVVCKVELSGRNPQFYAESQSNPQGEARLQRVPFGVYLLRVTRDGFEPFSRQIEIQSAVPKRVEAILQVAKVVTEITVEDSAPLLDTSRPRLVLRAGQEQLADSVGSSLGRSTIDTIASMPGWVLEANAVLHPRGSEYDTQYVVDGMPLYDNRSLAFAPAFENDEFESVNVMTAGLPAEYGRRLGGVITLDTRRIAKPGRSFEANLQAGSYQSYLGSLLQQYRGDRTSLSAEIHGGHTLRYLDPPSLENFTNRANAGGFHVRLDRDVTARDRLSFYLRSSRTGFQVPNDQLQQAAGQRQGRNGNETAGQIHYLKSISSGTLLSLRGMVRDLTATLESNPLSTPVYAQQDRGFREGALMGDISHQREHHSLKFGGDVRVSAIRERFEYGLPGQLPNLEANFLGQKRGTESSAFAQDQMHFGNFAASIGMRFDQYSLLIEDQALSPRLAVSYYVPRADLQIRATYDRVFEPPPSENLLFSSAAPSLGIDAVQASIPVPASRANFYEVGISKSFWKAFRLDVSQYWRQFQNYLDDDVFLNTGLSFPITFRSASIRGTEARLELPSWHNLSSFISYANMIGHASSPVTGGLFVEGGDAVELRDPGLVFPITQDQRNTAAGQARWEIRPRVWVMSEAHYGSGLPVELQQDASGGAQQQEIPQSILDKVNFDRGRVRPSFTLDLALGARVWQQGERSATIQMDVRNLTDRLNVINFSGLFSGTALAPGRQLSLQLKTRF